MIRIPVYKPDLSGNEKIYVNECLDSSWISSKGDFIPRFEQEFSKFIGVKHSSTVSNGTVALHLSLVVLGIGAGDEIIVPTLTYIASVNAIAYTGATPVFVDSLMDSWQMDPEDIRKKITPKTRGIMVVHLYGHPCDMDQIIKIAGEHGLFIIEDCAEAFGSLYKGRHVGTYGDISIFSFFGNKTVTCGEGGMVVTNDEKLHNSVVHYKSQGLVKYRTYWHDVIAYNYRMTNICAAIGLAQLERAAQFIEKKRQIALWYIDNLKTLPVEYHRENGDIRHNYWMFSILVSDPLNREPLSVFLAENGIETRPLFYPVHTMPMYSQNSRKFPVAEELGSRGINLPSYPMLTKDDVEFVCGKIKEFYS